MYDDEFLPDNILEGLDGGSVALSELEEQETEKYWALEGAKEVSQKIMTIQEEMTRRLNTSSLFNKIERSHFYYFGYFDQTADWGDTAITVVGENGQILDFAVNYYRYLARQLLTMTVSDRPTYRVQAANADLESRIQAKLGKQVLDFYLEKKGLEDKFSACMEDAIAHGVGFMAVTWNPAAGGLTYNEDYGEELYEGDVDVSVINISDVIWEFEDKNELDDLRWVAIRKRYNRWELASRFPEYGREILSTSRMPFEQHQAREAVYDMDYMEDWVDVIEFYHKPTEAIPDGRMVMFLEWDSETVLLDIDLPYKRLPFYIARAGRVPDKLLGWTPLFDIQKQQELLNEELAKVATMHDNLGLPLVWTKTGSKQGDPALWIGNVAWIESDQAPELVNLYEVPEDVYRQIEYLVSSMEKVVGLSPAVQGETSGSVRANRMQVFLAEQTRRFNSELERARFRLFEDVGTAILETVQSFAHSERVIEVVGETGFDELQAFSEGDLYNVVGVKVEAGSPLTRTVEGRLEVIQLLIQNQIPIVKEEILAILSGAPLESITRGVESQLNLAVAENESFLRGEDSHRALAIDDQLLHVRKHAEVLSMPRGRLDEEIVNRVLSACAEHLGLYNNPNVFDFQLALGYAEIPPKAPGGGGAPPGPQGGEPAGSPQEAPAAAPPNPQGVRTPQPEARREPVTA